MLAVLTHERPDNSADKNQITGRAALTTDVLNRLQAHSINGYSLREQVVALVEEFEKPIDFFQLDRAGNEPGRLAFAAVARRCDTQLLSVLARAHLEACVRTGPELDAVNYFEARMRDFGFDKGLPAPLLTGQRVTPELAAQVAETALAGANPLRKNAYKVPLTKAVVRRTVAELAARA